MDSLNSMPLTPDGEESDDYMDFFCSSSMLNKITESSSRNTFEDSACFNCKGELEESNLLLRDSYQNQEYLSNLIKDGTPCLFNVIEKNIFGKRVCRSQLHCRISHYFMILKQNINVLEDQSKSGMSYNTRGRKSVEIRKDICNFFFLLSSHLKNVSSENQDFRMTVISEIFDLLRFMNSFCSSSQYLTGISSPLGNQSTSGIHHYFHAQLDVRWWALCILHQIDAGSFVTELPDNVEPLVEEVSLENPVFISVFDSCASFVAWDIILLVHRQIMNTDYMNKNIPAFPCTCVHELSSSLLHILDKRAKLFKQKGFWDIMKDKLLVLMKMAECPDRKLIPIVAYCPLFSSDFSPRISLKQVWHIFIELAKLYDWNDKGMMVSDRSDVIKAEPKLLKTLIRLSLKDTSQQTSEGDIRFYLQSCLVLMDLWQKDKNCKGIEWITVLWEFMSKNMNSSFYLCKNTLDSFSNQRKSPKDWFKQLNETDSDPFSTGKNDSSYYIFLKLIVGQLKSEGNWKVLQGRIYSKFHEKKMLELNSNGIYNTVSLFLIIGLHGDLFLLSNKLLELLSLIPNGALGKLPVVFNGLFTIALSLINKCSDFATATKFLEERLLYVYKTIFSGSKDRRELCSLVVLYSEATIVILEKSSDFSLSQEKLFCAPLAQVIGVIPSAEKFTVLSAVNSALLNILDCSQIPHLLSDGRCLQLLLKLWNQYGAHLKYQPTADDSTRVSQVASSFVLCCVNLYSIAGSEKPALKDMSAELLSRFINNNTSCAVMSQTFIIKMLTDKMATRNALNIFPNLEEKIVNYSISNLISHGESSDIDELFVLIFRLPGLANLVPDPSCHPFRAIEDLFIALVQKFCQFEEFKPRLEIKEKAAKYFHGLENYIQSVVNKSPVPGHIHQIMSFVGELFIHGGQIFYLRGKPNCLLPSLINKLILPSTIYSVDKPLVKTVADAFRLLIPKVLLGLVILNPSCDAYAQRCFRDIIIHYLYRFQSMDHPFLMFFGHEKGQAMRSIFLEILKDNYITKRKCPISHLHILFELLLRLLSSNQNEWILKICKHLFLNVLDLLLILDDSNSKFINNFLSKLFRQNEIIGGYYRVELLEGIRKFVSCQLKWSSKRVFAILTGMCDIDSSLIADSMDKILTVICETEEKRGTGCDAVLRKGYSELENKLK